MTTPGLSVVMIAKNSEQYLSVVLRSLVEVADEIVVVDTSSTDSTLDIARNHGCRLFLQLFAESNDYRELSILGSLYRAVLPVTFCYGTYRQSFRDKKTFRLPLLR